MRIAIIGRGEWLIKSTKEIMQYGEILLVITAKGANHYKSSLEDYEELARQTGAKFIESPPSDAELQNLLTNAKIDIVCSANYPQIISTQNLRIPKYGWLNAHPAPLPKYRGNACPNWAILNNDDSYEIVVHEMSDILDGGPVLSRHKFDMTSATYIGHIYEIMIAEYPSLFSKAISMKIQNISGEEQNEGQGYHRHEVTQSQKGGANQNQEVPGPAADSGGIHQRLLP
jgi:methionyl-tRNA formyltransferase